MEVILHGHHSLIVPKNVDLVSGNEQEPAQILHQLMEERNVLDLLN